MRPDRTGALASPDVPLIAKATFGLAMLMNLYAVVRVVTHEDVTISAVADGAFSPDGALLSPAQPAFAIWSAIYVGVFGHAVRVWLPDLAAHRRRHRVVLPAIAAAVLNTLWLVCAQRGYVEGTAIVVALLAATVWFLMEGARRSPANEASSLVLIDGTYGLYLGWLLIATAGNAQVVFTQWWGQPIGTVPLAVALGLLTLSGGLALVAVHRFRANVLLPAAFVWGLFWLVRSRSKGLLPQPEIAVAATVAAAVIVGAFAVWAGPPARLIRQLRARVSP